MYERSYMHRDILDHVVVTKTDFIITTSVDGHVKFWKKSSDKGIEFVKHFRAHMEAAVAVAVSVDGTMFATASTDRQVKVFDVVNFDMIGIIAVDCLPLALCWIKDPLDQSTCIAVSDSDSPSVYIYDPYAGPEPKRIVKDVHRKPVSLMAYNPVAECVVSVDTGGMIEYWTIGEPHRLPTLVEFELKSQTSLYEFKKQKCTPNSLTFSPDFELFACTSTEDAVVRVFRFATGKLYRSYDESVAAASMMQNQDDDRFKLDGM
ncbi:Peptidyl-prolyl cis-trans isomerase cyp15, partial [Linderina macrospora]